MIFYRIVRTNPPTPDDFLSHQAKGLRPAPPNADAATRRIWEGVSVFAAAEQARENALVFPRLGRFLAALDIAEDGPIPAERTGKAEGHYTLWAEAGDLLARVVDVLPV